MSALHIAFLLITASVVICEEVNRTSPVLPEAKHFKFEDQVNAEPKYFKFEDQNDAHSYGLIKFEDQRFDANDNAIGDGNRIKFEADNAFEDNKFQQNQDFNEGQKVKFEEDKGIKRPKQKKRRRRPKRLPSGGLGGYPVQYPGPPVYQGLSAYPGSPAFGPGTIYPGQSPYLPYPVTYKPRPSATSAALSAVTEALTSVALYDDAQCVPRLLCEAAGGGAVPGSGILQSVAGLQPLLTLLSAYNGISSSPLFVFGRAVFLGMTSKANPGTCRYAYSQCPTDPEQLVHYLNNHNGGFFRFFAAPQLNQQQGLEQFYDQLSGQHYGLYQPQAGPPHHLQDQQGYGLQQNQNQHYSQQFGQYQQYLPQQYQNPLQGYGLQQYNQNYQTPNPYTNGYGLYGQNYPYQKSINQTSFENKIQRRIQNVRPESVDNISSKPKWLFPEDSLHSDVYRLGKILRFPQSNVNSIGGAQFFPGIQSNREYKEIEALDNTRFEQNGVDDYKFSDQNKYTTVNDDRIVYIVRGNGDPNHPEIVRLAPGQTLYNLSM